MHDEGDGSFSQGVAARMRYWNGSQWVRWDGTLQTGDIEIGAVEIKDASSDNRVSVSAGGALKVDNSGVTQPVSAVSLPLPTGAAKDSTLTDGTARVGGTVAVTQSTSPWVVSGGANAFHVDDNSGSLTVDAPVATPLFARLSDGSAALIGQKAMASSLPVVLASDQASIPVAATLSAETTKVIGTVNQGTSPWVTSRNWTLGSGTDSVSAVQSGTWTVTSTAESALAADSTGSLPSVVKVMGGYDGSSVHVLTVRQKDGVGMLHTADQQVRQELEHVHVLLVEQNEILRQLLGERPDLY